MRKQRAFLAVVLTFCLTLLLSGTAMAATPGQALDAKEVKYGTISKADQKILKSMFNAEEYAAMNADVVNAVGKDANKLFAHFVKYGVFEGRGPSKSFNVSAYKSSYGDLQKAFGTDIMAYYRHYNDYGKKEKRELITVEKAEAAGVIIQSVVPGATKTVLTPSQEYDQTHSSSSSSSTASSTTTTTTTTTTPASDVSANAISLAVTSIDDLEVGTVAAVAITPSPADATDSYSASSSDTAVASVNVVGKDVMITGVATGTATITVNSTRTGTPVTAKTISVEVIAASTTTTTTNLTSIQLGTGASTATIGATEETISFDITFDPTGATDKTYTASVESGALEITSAANAGTIVLSRKSGTAGKGDGTAVTLTVTPTDTNASAVTVAITVSESTETAHQ